MKSRSGEKIKLTSLDELLGTDKVNDCVELDLSEIYAFKNHPFRVIDDEKMDELVESVKQNGILTPVIVRESINGYELISGHRRTHAAKRVGLTKIPAIIKELNDDDAVILMVDANIQREEILPSEKAYAFKMKFDALSHQGASSGHDVPKLTTDIIGDESGVSGRQVKRYIRLTQLIPELLELVDEKKVSMVKGIEISYLDNPIQYIVNDHIRAGNSITSGQITKLKNESENGLVTKDKVLKILGRIKSENKPRKVVIKEDILGKYFPNVYSEEDIQKLIIDYFKEMKAGVGSDEI